MHQAGNAAATANAVKIDTFLKLQHCLRIKPAPSARHA
jgi:hypothetical protein